MYLKLGLRRIKLLLQIKAPKEWLEAIFEIELKYKVAVILLGCYKFVKPQNLEYQYYFINNL